MIWVVSWVQCVQRTAGTFPSILGTELPTECFRNAYECPSLINNQRLLLAAEPSWTFRQCVIIMFFIIRDHKKVSLMTSLFCSHQFYIKLLFFFFSSRRRHTRYWRDWSSDVCSSDLPALRNSVHRSQGGQFRMQVESPAIEEIRTELRKAGRRRDAVTVGAAILLGGLV